MKNAKPLIITLIALLGAVIVILIGILMYIFGVTNDLPDKINVTQPKAVFLDEGFSSDEINRISIESDCGNIDFKRSESNQIRVVADGNNSKSFSAEVVDGTLNIVSKSEKKIDKSKFLKGNFSGANIDIYIPKELESISITSSYGDITLENKISGNIKITSAMGDIKTASILGIVDIHTDMGDIDISKLSLEGSSEITTNMGDIEIEKTNSVKINATTSLGKCYVNNSNEQSDITLTASTDLGDIEIN